MSQNNSQFQEILDAAKEKRGDLPVDTMIVIFSSSHRCVCSFCVEGLEFYCEQDSHLDIVRVPKKGCMKTTCLR